MELKLKKVIEDLFDDTNPIYKKTVARSIDVIQPLGYETIQRLEPRVTSSTREHTKTPINFKRKIFQFPEAIYPKSMINRQTMVNQSDFQIKDLGRKNQLVRGENFKQFLDRQQSILKNRNRINWFSTPEQEMIKYIQLIQYVRRDHFFTISNKALSQYFYFCQCSNSSFQRYLNSYIEKQIIQYKVTATQCLSTFTQENSSNFKINIEDQQQVSRYIESLNQSNMKSDPFYSGYKIFFGLQDMPVVDGEDFAQQQERYLKYLQYYILMITGLLGNDQLAILKLYSSIYQKTNEFIYLLRMIFQKITLVKPMLSNNLSHQKYIICENYKKSAGEDVKRMLCRNFGLLKQFGENKLLIRPEIIDKTEYREVMTDYNNRILHNEFKKLNNMFNQNPNMLYLPCQQYITSKLKYAYSPDDYINKSLARLFQQKRKIQQQDAKVEQKKAVAQTPKKVQEAPKKGILSLLGRKKDV